MAKQSPAKTKMLASQAKKAALARRDEKKVSAQDILDMADRNRKREEKA